MATQNENSLDIDQVFAGLRKAVETLSGKERTDFLRVLQGHTDLIYLLTGKHEKEQESHDDQ